MGPRAAARLLQHDGWVNLAGLITYLSLLCCPGAVFTDTAHHKFIRYSFLLCDSPASAVIPLLTGRGDVSLAVPVSPAPPRPAPPRVGITRAAPTLAVLGPCVDIAHGDIGTPGHRVTRGRGSTSLYLSFIHRLDNNIYQFKYVQAVWVIQRMSNKRRASLQHTDRHSTRHKTIHNLPTVQDWFLSVWVMRLLVVAPGHYKWMN